MKQLEIVNNKGHEAITALIKLLGKENVICEHISLKDCETATFATKSKVMAIIKPTNLKQVQECLKIANQYQIPIYPISGGTNWGCGSRVPPQTQSVVMDLSRLNQIVDFNEKQAYITVEPGVSFRQVYEYLRDRHSNLFIAVIGGSPDSSVIGNALERGDGIGPYGDRANYICGLEVVLPTGECIHTGFGRFKDVKTAAVSRWGVGPYLDGLFTQSNLGIVTKMTVWLMPKPKYWQSFVCLFKDSSRLEGAIEALRELILQGTIKDNCFSFWNCYKALAREGRYPWKITNGKTPLSLQELKGCETWIGNGSLYAASRDQADAERKIIEEALTDKVDKLIFQTQETHPEMVNNSLDVGVPTEANIKSTYWRKKTPVPSNLNPDRDGCGVIWLCPLLPFDGGEILQLLPSIESMIKQSGFEPNLALSCASARTIHMYIALMYDRDLEGEDEKAMKCHDQLLRFIIEQGYMPYRLGIHSMNSLPLPQDDYGMLLSKLKQSLDPHNILAPGRYDFSKSWPS